MMPSLMMMTSTRAGVTTIRLSIDKGKIFLSLTFFHHFLILYILYCLQLQCYKNSVCLVLCLALQLQLIEFSKGGAAMHDSVVLDLCTCWDRIFQHFSNISQSCVRMTTSLVWLKIMCRVAALEIHRTKTVCCVKICFVTKL